MIDICPRKKKENTNIRNNNSNIIEKCCTKCNEWKEEATFYYMKNKSKPELGYMPVCKSCQSKDNYEREKKYPLRRKKSLKKWTSKPEVKEKTYERMKKRREEGKVLEWQRNNKDKIRKYNDRRKTKMFKISKKEWIACKNYFDNSCAYCGIHEDDHYIILSGKSTKSDLHKEHVIQGGRNDLKNCVPSCKSCNGSKNVFSFNNWYNPSNVNYTYERYLRIYNWIRYGHKDIQKKTKKNN